MLRVNQLAGLGASFGVVPPKFLGYDNSTSGGSTYTFAGSPMAGKAGGYILVAASSANASTSPAFSSGSADGQAFSQLYNFPTSNARVAWLLAASTANQTGTISITWSAASLRTTIGIWFVERLSSLTAYDTAGDSNTDPSDTIDIPARGMLLGYLYNPESGSTTTWTGPTEDFDQVIDTTRNISGASKAYRSAQTGLTVTAALSGAANPHTILAAISMR